MSIKTFFFNIWPVLAFLALVTFMFLPEYQGKTLERGDQIQGIAKTKLLREYNEKNDRSYIWNPAQFAGMPMLYGAPSSSNVITYVDKVFKLGQNRPMAIFFVALLSAFLLGRIGFGMNNLLSILLAVSSALPLTNLILWKAGHTSKIDVLSYTSLLILGVVLIFEKKKYVLGFLITAFAVAMSLYLRHPQMSYYIFMVFIIYGVLKLVQLAKGQVDWKSLLFGVGLVVTAALIGVGSSATKIWSMKTHSEQSMRGAPILTNANLGGADSSSKVEGLNWNYAMQWSNGLIDIGGTFIPRFVGGGSGEKVGTKSESFKNFRIERAPLYWGDLPFTEAPMYLGAISIFLFLLGALYVRGILKWWLVLGVLLTYLISMGSNFEWFNKLIFDYLPLYNKFRAPQSILSITPYFLSLLGVMAIYRLIKEGASKDFDRALYISGGVLGGFALLSWLVLPGVLSFESAGDGRYAQQGLDISAFVADRKSVLKSDSLRSLIFVVLSFGVLWAYSKSKINQNVLLAALIVLVIVDNIGINNRYLSFSDYVSQRKIDNTFQPRPVDQQIMNAEQNRYDYRVMDLTINTFNAANTSYFHNTIGGYDPVKLQRIQDVIDGYISKSNMGVYNMLNTKYFITGGTDGQAQIQRNPGALGTAWFVDKIRSVSTPDEEFAALENLDAKTEAVILSSEFDQNINSADLNSLSNNGTINITSYEPDKIVYSTTNNGAGLAVFSEIWFDGKSWKVYIDGEEAPLLRANYLLRAVMVPAGDHEVVFEFRPVSYYTGEKITLASSLVLLLLGLGALGMYLKSEFLNQNSDLEIKNKSYKSTKKKSKTKK